MPYLSATLLEVHVDLDALRQNYSWFAGQAPNSETSAAVKANAYGMGLHAAAPALADAGCGTFYVAHLAEGVKLRKILGAKSSIYVLHGPGSDDATYFTEHGLRPVLNSVEQIGTWQKNGKTQACAVHFDTGMNRLGLPVETAEQIDTSHLNVALVMSHLACAATPEHPLNQTQLSRFQQIREKYSNIPASFSNSAGVLLGPAYHFEQTRPGIGLYGGTCLDPEFTAPELAAVAQIFAPVIQVRDLKQGEHIGYGARFEATHDMQIAIIAYGYADGLFRSASPKGTGRFDGQNLPLLGQVSMDLMAVDISQTNRPPKIGNFIEFWGAELDNFAQSCGTVPYELLTSVGHRVKRIYKGSKA